MSATGCTHTRVNDAGCCESCGATIEFPLPVSAPAQEVTRPIEEQLWSLAMSVYHAGGNNHDFCEQATALLAYKLPEAEVAECDCDSCKAGNKEVMDYASLRSTRTGEAGTG